MMHGAATSLRCAIGIAPLGELSDPTAIVQLARAAEASGSDGLSIWDSTDISMGGAAADPFVTLAAVASATERLRLIAPERSGTMLGRIDEERASLGRADDPFDVADFGISDPGGPAVVRSHAKQGASWWLVSLSPMRGSLDSLLAIVDDGPPLG